MPRPPPRPAFACAKETDYYAKVTTKCAADSCNAKQQNLGGDLIVLDVSSYGSPGCQGCNPPNPASCCQQCQDTDGCNAWVVCTNKVRWAGRGVLCALAPTRATMPADMLQTCAPSQDGCGSGCAAYAKQNTNPSAPLSWSDPLPHKGW